MRNHECPRVSSAPVWHPSDSTSTPARHYARAPCHPRVPALATLKQRSKATVRAGPVRSTRTPMRGPRPQSCRRPGPDDQNAPPDISRYALNVEPVGSGVALFRGSGRPGEVAQRRDVLFIQNTKTRACPHHIPHSQKKRWHPGSYVVFLSQF